MANTLTGLIPTIYNSLDVVSRELIGFIPNVMRDATAQSGAVGQTVRSPVVPAASLEDITPGNDPADSGDQTIGYTDLSITKSKAYPIRWTGEEQLSVTKDGVINTILRDQFSQAFRTLANAVETDLGALYAGASRAYGTAGTTPFATADDMTDLAEVNRILDDNGAPQSGRVMVVGSAARAKLEGKQSQLFKVNEAGDAGAMLRERQMRMLHGFVMGTSAGVASHVAGTGTLYDAAGGEPVGETTIALDGGTAGATGIKAGDVVTFAGDTNKYVVTTGISGVSGDIVLGAPGLRLALADTVEMTIGAGYTANMAFSQNAMLLAARVPAMPIGGDEATDVTTVQDPVSGLVFQIAMYKQYRRIKYEVGLAWGVKMVKPEHCAILLG
ncbi:P22 phage major capsid protein family protein [Salipiger marinus]|uniref:P22 phage major capsid protein family protein n=1 Tax=Salipiger marinus TaxID=555512 RepID=UPI002C5DBD08|nr:P22 phage major capsid protein family protein [Salipiger manganoxidans]MEB3419912.1 P22 phage major capsid protein family protein [Salipiger manganoxidans]